MHLELACWPGTPPRRTLEQFQPIGSVPPKASRSPVCRIFKWRPKTPPAMPRPGCRTTNRPKGWSTRSADLGCQASPKTCLRPWSRPRYRHQMNPETPRFRPRRPSAALPEGFTAPVTQNPKVPRFRMDCVCGLSCPKVFKNRSTIRQSRSPGGIPDWLCHHTRRRRGPASDRPKAFCRGHRPEQGTRRHRAPSGMAVNPKIAGHLTLPRTTPPEGGFEGSRSRNIIRFSCLMRYPPSTFNRG